MGLCLCIMTINSFLKSNFCNMKGSKDIFKLKISRIEKSLANTDSTIKNSYFAMNH